LGESPTSSEGIWRSFLRTLQGREALFQNGTLSQAFAELEDVAGSADDLAPALQSTDTVEALRSLSAEAQDAVPPWSARDSLITLTGNPSRMDR
jgi:hypothetical protein